MGERCAPLGWPCDGVAVGLFGAVWVRAWLVGFVRYECGWLAAWLPNERHGKSVKHAARTVERCHVSTHQEKDFTPLGFGGSGSCAERERF